MLLGERIQTVLQGALPFLCTLPLPKRLLIPLLIFLPLLYHSIVLFSPNHPRSLGTAIPGEFVVDQLVLQFLVIVLQLLVGLAAGLEVALVLVEQGG